MTARANVPTRLNYVLMAAILAQIQYASALVLPNSFRYARNDQDLHYTEQVPDLLVDSQHSSIDPYKINRDLSQSGSSSELQLDDEDRRILNKFYSETRNQDPFLHDSFTSQSLWDDAQDEDLNYALIDQNHKQPKKASLQPLTNRYVAPPTPPPAANRPNEWTFDTTLVGLAEKMTGSLLDNDITKGAPASYSPDIKILTLYNPLEGALSKEHRDRVVGATLFASDEQSRPNVKSKSPVEAIKLHDELMEEPPKDGKVRVRMYFHRAIHDDAKLYGTGPWKYWGHGWGVEFGYDPKKDTKKDFYQKGYTIERAFGRDFCRDQKNCRPPDPEFMRFQQRERRT